MVVRSVMMVLSIVRFEIEARAVVGDGGGCRAGVEVEGNRPVGTALRSCSECRVA